MPLRGALPGDGLQPLRDLDQIRNFISGGGPAAFSDLPFLPIQIIICFLIHPLIGWATVFGATVIFFLTLATDLSVRRLTHASLREVEPAHRGARIGTAECRGARALGMVGRVAERWAQINRAYEDSHVKVLERSGGFAGVSRVFRMLFQSGVLGVGAFLVIEQQASFGVIIAASILSARALQPVEQLVANWRGFVASRQGWRRLKTTLAQLPRRRGAMPLPAPKRASWSSRSPWFPRPPNARPSSMSASRSPPATGSASSDRAAPASPRWCAPRSAPGCPSAAACGSTARRSTVGPGRARPPYRLPAAGRRAVRRDHRREHRPLRAGRRLRGDPGGGAGGRRPRDGPAAAQRLLDPDRRSRRRRSPPASASALRLPAPSMATPSSSFSTSPTPTSTPKATQR